jgi:hypothetical protein
MKTKLLLAATLLALTGCANLPFPGSAPKPPGGVHADVYDAEPGRDAAFVARMRAAPPPVEPDVREGKSAAGDLRLLNGQGYVRIGVGHFRADDAAARAQAAELGREVGADQVLLYRVPHASIASGAASVRDPSGTASDSLRAVYFVRLRLAFGATFRDLEPAERARLGDRDGVQIGSVIGGSPASDANLRAGDFVLAIDGAPVRGKADFQNRLKARAGQAVTLTVNRNGHDMQRMVRLGAIATDRP